MEFLFFGLILLAIPFVLPILAWLSARSARQHFEVLQGQLETLTRVVESQEKEIDGLRASVARLAGAAAGRALAGRNADPRAGRHRSARHRSTRCRSVNGCRPVTSGASAARRASGRANCRSAVFSGGRSTAACASRAGVSSGGSANCVARCHAAAEPAATAATRASRASAAATRVRLGRSCRGESVLRDRGSSPGDRGGKFPSLFDRSRMAPAAGPCRDRRRRRACVADCLRAQGRPPVSGDGERHGRGGNCRPLRDVLCCARPVEPDSRYRGVRAAGGRHGARGIALHTARVAVHRRPRTARRLRDACAPLDGREPPDTAFRLPASAQYRTRAGRAQETLADPDRAHPRLHDDLSVGLGDEVPERQQPAAGDERLPPLPARRVCERAGATQPSGGCRRHREDVRVDGGDLGGDAAALRLLPGGGAGLRRASRPALRIFVSRRRGAAGAGDRSRPRGPPCRQCRDDAARDGDVDGELVQAVHGSAPACWHRRRFLDVLPAGAAGRRLVLASLYRHSEGGRLRRSASARGICRSGRHRAAVRRPVAAHGRAAAPGDVDRVARDQLEHRIAATSSQRSSRLRRRQSGRQRISPSNV